MDDRYRAVSGSAKVQTMDALAETSDYNKLLESFSNLDEAKVFASSTAAELNEKVSIFDLEKSCYVFATE